MKWVYLKLLIIYVTLNIRVGMTKVSYILGGVVHDN